MDLERLKYPIGKFNPKQEFSSRNLKKWRKTIRKFPKRLKKVVVDLSAEQLNTPYRPGGWTVKQVVHHVADSHINSYVRFKWTLTEDTPIIKAYDEKLWAMLPDANDDNLQHTFTILKGIHGRWTCLLEGMSHNDFQQNLSHPEWKNNLSLGTMLALYAWHCDHHLAHITELIKRENW